MHQNQTDADRGWVQYRLPPWASTSTINYWREEILKTKTHL
jgi:hypothetical protein